MIPSVKQTSGIDVIPSQNNSFNGQINSRNPAKQQESIRTKFKSLNGVEREIDDDQLCRESGNLRKQVLKSNFKQYVNGFKKVLGKSLSKTNRQGPSESVEDKPQLESFDESFELKVANATQQQADKYIPRRILYRPPPIIIPQVRVHNSRLQEIELLNRQRPQVDNRKKANEPLVKSNPKEQEFKEPAELVSPVVQ